MLEPLLRGMLVIIRRHAEPFIAQVAEHTLCIEFSNMRVLGKEVVALLECVNVFAVSETG